MSDHGDDHGHDDDHGGHGHGAVAEREPQHIGHAGRDVRLERLTGVIGDAAQLVEMLAAPRLVPLLVTMW